MSHRSIRQGSGVQIYTWESVTLMWHDEGRAATNCGQGMVGVDTWDLTEFEKPTGFGSFRSQVTSSNLPNLVTDFYFYSLLVCNFRVRMEDPPGKWPVSSSRDVFLVILLNFHPEFAKRLGEKIRYQQTRFGVAPLSLFIPPVNISQERSLFLMVLKPDGALEPPEPNWVGSATKWSKHCDGVEISTRCVPWCVSLTPFSGSQPHLSTGSFPKTWRTIITHERNFRMKKIQSNNLNTTVTHEEFGWNAQIRSHHSIHFHFGSRNGCYADWSHNLLRCRIANIRVVLVWCRSSTGNPQAPHPIQSENARKVTKVPVTTTTAEDGLPLTHAFFVVWQLIQDDGPGARKCSILTHWQGLSKSTGLSSWGALPFWSYHSAHMFYSSYLLGLLL